VRVENRGENEEFGGNDGKKVIRNLSVQLHFCICNTKTRLGTTGIQAKIRKFMRMTKKRL